MFHPEIKNFFSRLFPGAKKHRGSVSCHTSLPPEQPSGHFRSSRWKPRHQSGHPSERANGLCPSTYRTHICTFPWQGLHGNTSGSWSTVEYTSLAWLSPLGNLPRRPGGSKGLSSMFTWTVGLSAPPPLYRPELLPIWSCKCCSTYAR